MFMRSLVLKVAGWSFTERTVRHSFLFRPLVKRFVAGDTLEEGMQASEALMDRGFLISLDLLGENVHSVAEANAAKEAYIEMLHRVKQSKHYKPYVLGGERPPVYTEIESLNISIKLTQCGFDQSDELTESNLREVLTIARDHNNFVRIDMEGSDYTERTVAIIEKMADEFPNVGTVLQAYLFRTQSDLDRLMARGLRLRMVKGAYLEPPTVAEPSKAKVDEDYIRFAKQMLKQANYPAIATHDPKVLAELKQFIEAEKIDRESFEFQMIYGVRRDLQDQLLAEGYRVRIYVPFGDSWYPYFSRRLAERPANMWFIFKSLFRR